MGGKIRSLSRAIAGGVLGAIRARPKVFVGVTVAVVIINLALPPLVLSVARKPWNHFSINPWLHNIPHWLVSAPAPAEEKLAFLSNVAIFWFVADSPYDAPEWGFTATVRDMGRWIFMGMLFGVYFALWSQLRRLPGPRATTLGGLRGRGGVAGTLLTTLGFSSMPCSVAGCGAPILPVVGLALTGLSSGTLVAISLGSRVLISVLLLAVALSVIYSARVAYGRASPTRPMMS